MQIHYINIAFTGVKIFDTRGVSLGVLATDHFHPFFEIFLDEEVLVNISEKVQFHVCHFKCSLTRTNQGKCNYWWDQDHNVEGTRLWGFWTRAPVKTHRLTDRSCDNLQGWSCLSGWTTFRRGCNLSLRCLVLLINYRRSLWVETLVLEIVQRSLYIHMGNACLCHQHQVFFNLLFVVVDPPWVLEVGKDSFGIPHGGAWLRSLLHPLRRYWLVVDLVI